MSTWQEVETKIENRQPISAGFHLTFRLNAETPGYLETPSAA